jgi:CXXC-20-CXXC protein
MKIRTCPHCNYKYSLSEYVKNIVFKFVFSEWACPKCSKKITFDFGRRVIVALCFGGLYILLSLLISFLRNEIGMTPFMWIVLLVLYVIGSVFIFTFDTFRKAD